MESAEHVFPLVVRLSRIRPPTTTARLPTRHYTRRDDSKTNRTKECHRNGIPDGGVDATSSIACWN